MANDSILIQVQLGTPTRANINAVTRQIQSALSNVSANVQIQNGRQATQTLQNIKSKTDAATKSTTSFADAIGLSGRRFVAFTSAVAVVGRLTSALSQATREAIKFEREFVKLAQVFDTDVRSLKGLQNSISDLSKEFGLSANVIAKTSVVLAQSGLTAKQTEEAMKTLAKTTLAATFDSIASSTEGAVAIMAQFGTEASKLESQLGAINAVSKRFAVESGDIIEAVRRAGGAFRAAGGNLNDFIGLFTAVRSTTRESAETIATGFRTIFARLQRPKTIDFFRQLNIELTDGKGNFIGAFEAIRRLSDGLRQAGIEAGSIKFAGVVEQLGGIRQVSRVIPLLGEFAKAEKARQVAIAGAGSLDADAAKAQETLSQSFARTTENFRALIREITQTASFQAIIKIALALANSFIEVARSLKPLIPLIAAFGAIKLGGLASGAIRSGVGGAGGTGGLGKGFNKGGKVLGFNRGGTVPGTGNGDTVPAMLEPGEFVIRKSAVQAFGADRLSGINKYKGGTGNKGVTKPKNLSTVDEKLRYERFGRIGSQGLGRTEVKYKDIDSIGLEPAVAGGLKGAMYEKYMLNRFKVSKPDGTGQFPDVNASKAASILKESGLSSKVGNKLLDGAELKYRLTKDTIFKYREGLRKQKKAKNIPMIYAEGEKFAKGGAVGTDTVPALLTPGEFVINKESAKSFGYGNLGKINKYAKGGPVQKFAGGGIAGGAAGGALALSVAIGALGDELQEVVAGLAKFSIAVLLITSIGLRFSTSLKKLSDNNKKAREDEIKKSEEFQASLEAASQEAKQLSQQGGRLNKAGVTEKGPLLQQKKAEEAAAQAKVDNLKASGLGGAFPDRVAKADKELAEATRKRSQVERLLLKKRKKNARRKEVLDKAGQGNQTKLNKAIKEEEKRRKTGFRKGQKSLGAEKKPGIGASLKENAGGFAIQAVAVAAGLAAAAFTVAAESAKKLSEAFIQSGDAQAAAKAAASAAQSETLSTGAIVVGVIATTALAIAGIPAAIAGGVAAGFTAAGAILGTVLVASFAALTGLALPGAINAIQTFANVAFTVSKFLLDRIPDFLFSPERKNKLLAFIPDPKKTEILAASQAAFKTELINSEKSLKDFNEQADRLQTTFAQVGDERKKELIGTQAASLGGKDLTKPLERYISELENGQTVVVTSSELLERMNKEFKDLNEANRTLTQQETRRKDFLLLLIEQEAGAIGALKERINSEIKVGSQVFKTARAQDVLLKTIEDVNAGQRITLDTNGLVNRSTIQDGSKLHKMYQALLATGAGEESARAEITKMILGEVSIRQQLQQNLEKLGTFVGGELRDLLFGTFEEQAKAARKVNASFAVLSDPSKFQNLGSQGKKEVSSFIGALGNAGISEFNGRKIIGQGSIGEQIATDSLRSSGVDPRLLTNLPQGVQDAVQGGLLGIDVGAQKRLQELEKIRRATEATETHTDELKTDIPAATTAIEATDNQVKGKINALIKAQEDLLRTSNKDKWYSSVGNTEGLYPDAVIGGGQGRDSFPGFIGAQAKGGPVYASQGTMVPYVNRPKGVDTVPATTETGQPFMLQSGEFILRKSAVDNLKKKYGPGFLQSLNDGTLPISSVFAQNGGAVRYAGNGGSTDGSGLFDNLISAGNRLASGIESVVETVEGATDAANQAVQQEVQKGKEAERDINRTTNEAIGGLLPGGQDGRTPNLRGDLLKQVLQTQVIDPLKQKTAAFEGRRGPEELSPEEKKAAHKRADIEGQRLKTLEDEGRASDEYLAAQKRNLDKRRKAIDLGLKPVEDIMSDVAERVRPIKHSTGIRSRQDSFNDPRGATSGQRGASNFGKVRIGDKLVDRFGPNLAPSISSARLTKQDRQEIKEKREREALAKSKIKTDEAIRAAGGKFDPETGAFLGFDREERSKPEFRLPPKLSRQELGLATVSGEAEFKAAKAESARKAKEVTDEFGAAGATIGEDGSFQGFRSSRVLGVEQKRKAYRQKQFKRAVAGGHGYGYSGGRSLGFEDRKQQALESAAARKTKKSTQASQFEDRISAIQSESDKPISRKIAMARYRRMDSGEKGQLDKDIELKRKQEQDRIQEQEQARIKQQRTAEQKLQDEAKSSGNQQAPSQPNRAQLISNQSAPAASTSVEVPDFAKLESSSANLLAAANTLSTVLENHTIPETISLQVADLTVSISNPEILGALEPVVKQAIAAELVNFEDLTQSQGPGSYSRNNSAFGTENTA